MKNILALFILVTLCSARVSESISLRSKSQILIVARTTSQARQNIEKNYMAGYRVVSMVSQSITHEDEAEIQGSHHESNRASDIIIIMEK